MPAPKRSRLEPSAQQDAQPWRNRVHHRVRSPIAILTGLLGASKVTDALELSGLAQLFGS